ncbi:protein yippee-like At5g53940 isoform X1 [Raphanus sativus]|uniref:Protein yippee-like n=1 Tax=Raphanus sativus TaxID=3726 RepID=A0A6J0M868_RAPSA|nr:protein yippee-like At5g53940 isoform X1 [Raphanus sativus]
MGRIFTVELEGRSYRCRFCRTHLALPDDLISKSFHCRRGKAYLFNRSVNISMGPLEERMMLSGMHTVADIYCCCCGQNVGWKYRMRKIRSIKKANLFWKEEGSWMKHQQRVASMILEATQKILNMLALRFPSPPPFCCCVWNNVC